MPPWLARMLSWLATILSSFAWFDSIDPWFARIFSWLARIVSWLLITAGSDIVELLGKRVERREGPSCILTERRPGRAEKERLIRNRPGITSRFSPSPWNRWVAGG